MEKSKNSISKFAILIPIMIVLAITTAVLSSRGYLPKLSNEPETLSLGGGYKVRDVEVGTKLLYNKALNKAVVTNEYCLTEARIALNAAYELVTYKDRGDVDELVNNYTISNLKLKNCETKSALRLSKKLE